MCTGGEAHPDNDLLDEDTKEEIRGLEIGDQKCGLAKQAAP